MMKTLKERLLEANDALTKEREQRWKLRQELEEVQKEIKSLSDQRLDWQRQIDLLQMNLNGANGHIQGMRETLIGVGLMKEPKPPEPLPCNCPKPMPVEPMRYGGY